MIDIARSALCMASMHVRNRLSRRPIVAAGGPTVSLTSHGARVGFVHLAIESIGRGTLRPSRVVLWLDPDDPRAVDPPATLRRLVTRGLEIRRAPESLGPHTKYHPQVELDAGMTVTLVTSDDDVMHPRSWLSSLADASARNPGAVVAHRAHRVRLRGGAIAPYGEWERADSTDRSPRTFALGVGGVLYPPGFVEVIRAAGQRFRECAPRADDVWLHYLAVRSRTPIVALLENDDSVAIRGHGSGGLWQQNVDGHANDVQIRATYGADELAHLVEF